MTAVSSDKRIGHGQSREAAKIAIRGPERMYTMLNAESGDARVVNLGPADASGGYQPAQFGKGLIGFRQQDQRRRLKPGLDLIQSADYRCRRVIDSGMCHDGQEFMQAGPRNCPCRAPFGERRNRVRSRAVERSILAMRVNQNVGINRNQAPRPS